MNKHSVYVPQNHGRLLRYKDVPNLPQGLWEIKELVSPHTLLKHYVVVCRRTEHSQYKFNA